MQKEIIDRTDYLLSTDGWGVILPLKLPKKGKPGSPILHEKDHDRVPDP